MNGDGQGYREGEEGGMRKEAGRRRGKRRRKGW